MISLPPLALGDEREEDVEGGTLEGFDEAEVAAEGSGEAAGEGEAEPDAGGGVGGVLGGLGEGLEEAFELRADDAGAVVAQAEEGV